MVKRSRPSRNPRNFFLRFCGITLRTEYRLKVKNRFVVTRSMCVCANVRWLNVKEIKERFSDDQKSSNDRGQSPPHTVSLHGRCTEHQSWECAVSSQIHVLLLSVSEKLECSKSTQTEPIHHAIRFSRASELKPRHTSQYVMGRHLSGRSCWPVCPDPY